MPPTPERERFSITVNFPNLRRREDAVIIHELTGRHAERRETVSSLPMLVPGLWYDQAGRMYVLTYSQFAASPAQAQERYDPEKYRIISPTSPHVRLFSDSTKFQHWKREVYSMPDGLETAIRMVEDHILAGTRGKERSQVEGVLGQAREIQDIFAQGIHDLDDEVFRLFHKETVAIYEREEMDPKALREWHKRKMVELLEQASSGRDTLGRRNPLVSFMKLIRAERLAQMRNIALDRIEIKFDTILSALYTTRATSRGIFQSIAQRLGGEDRQRGIVASILFNTKRRPHLTEAETRIQAHVIGALFDSMSYQLTELIPLDPYRTTAVDAAYALEQMGDELGEIGKLFRRNRGGQALSTFYKARGSQRAQIEKIIDLLLSTLQDNSNIRKN